MKHILLFLLDGYADWEAGYTSAKLNKPELGFTVNTISLNKSSINSQGNFSTNIDYSLESFVDFDNLAAFIIIGGTGFGEQFLIKGYNYDKYNNNESCKITNFINRCLNSNILVAGICDGATFLADNGFLNLISHTGNTLEYLKNKAPFYSGDNFYKEKQAVSGGNIITANGTAVLEFVREILIKLNMLGSKEKAVEWFNNFKKGYYID